MIDSTTYEILRQALQVLMLASVPIVGVTALAGILVGILQAATTIQDSSSAYAIRLIALTGALYLVFTSVWQTLMSLLRLVLAGVH